MALVNPSGPPIEIPPDVVELLLRIFADGNAEVAGTFSRNPMTREDALDQVLISYLDRQSPEIAPDSGWVVDVETHFLGGGRHVGVWEIADIGVIVILRDGKTVKWSKVAILQSKRLFPVKSVHGYETERARFRWGFGRLLGSYEPMAARRVFEFTDQSRYESLNVTEAQSERIALYQEEVMIPVHYLLYNPVEIPWSRSIPAPSSSALPNNRVGCRVIRSAQIRELRNHNITIPTYGEVASIIAPHSFAPFSAGWRLEDFVVKLVLGCHEGRVLTKALDDAMEMLFYRRTGPIAAAFAVNIEMVS
jgi:hypothetical protein